MALIDHEGFDRETANVANWFNAFGSVSADGQGWNSYGRYGTGTFKRTYANNSGRVWLQAHVWLTSLANQTIFAVTDGTSDGGIVFQMDTAGKAIVKRGLTQIAATAGTVFAATTWHFIQLCVKIHSVSGEVEVWIDGSQVLTFSGNTRNGSNDYSNCWQAGGFNSRVDNVVVYDETGADAPNARTPATRVFTDLPTGAGATTEFTPSAGANYECVDEQPNDGDTTYNSAASAPLSDLYGYPAASVPSATIVYGVAVELVARKDDLGGDEINPLIRSNGATYESTPAIPLTTSYQRFKKTWIADPDTGAAWTVARANAAQVGVKRSV